MSLVPAFVHCTDGKWYQNLVYQDIPARRAWFLCFDDDEPAELVIRESAWKGGMRPADILRGRGFDQCVIRIFNGRSRAIRFFGQEKGKPTAAHPAISWFLSFRRGVPLPVPCGQDACDEIFSFYPNREGVYFGEKK